MNNKGFIGGTALAAVLIIGLICGILCIEKIPVGYEGVVYSMNGGVQQETLTQGWHIVSPTKRVKEFAISEEQLNLTHDKGESFQVSTSDNAGIAISFQTVTDKMIEQVADDMERMCGYLIDWEELIDDIYDELKQEAKEKIRKKYMDNLESKLEDVLGF